MSSPPWPDHQLTTETPWLWRLRGHAAFKRGRGEPTNCQALRGGNASAVLPLGLWKA